MKLFINTCFETVIIGVMLDGNLIHLESWKADRQESRKLTPKIAEIIKNLGKTKEDITSVYVVTGPGSFTAVRIGFIVAKAFASSLGCELYSCNSFEFLSYIYKDKYDFVELKAGGGKVYNINIKNASYVIEEPQNKLKVSDLNLKDDFKNSWSEVINKMELCEDIESLEPNYVKEPNITIAKG